MSVSSESLFNAAICRASKYGGYRFAICVPGVFFVAIVRSYAGLGRERKVLARRTAARALFSEAGRQAAAGPGELYLWEETFGKALRDG